MFYKNDFIFDSALALEQLHIKSIHVSCFNFFFKYHKQPSSAKGTNLPPAMTHHLIIIFTFIIVIFLSTAMMGGGELF